MSETLAPCPDCNTFSPSTDNHCRNCGRNLRATVPYGNEKTAERVIAELKRQLAAANERADKAETTLKALDEECARQIVALAQVTNHGIEVTHDLQAKLDTVTKELKDLREWPCEGDRPDCDTTLGHAYDNAHDRGDGSGVWFCRWCRDSLVAKIDAQSEFKRALQTEAAQAAVLALKQLVPGQDLKNELARAEKERDEARAEDSAELASEREANGKLRAKLDASAVRESGLREALAKTQFVWLIEAPGPAYLFATPTTRSFGWTTEPNEALRFRTRDEADHTMMAVYNFCRDLFVFPGPHGPRPVEHGFMEDALSSDPSPGVAARGAVVEAAKKWELWRETQCEHCDADQDEATCRCSEIGVALDEADDDLRSAVRNLRETEGR